MTADADLGELAAALGHGFRRPELLADAVTHPSLSGMVLWRGVSPVWYDGKR